MNNQLIDLKLKRTELKWKIIGTLLTGITILIGVIQYNDKQAHENYMEFKRSIWSKQMEVYSQSCRYAGLIAMNPNDSDFVRDVKKFGGLYWGEMIIVEDTLVEKAMKDFYEAIYDYTPEDEKSGFKLKYKADALAKACKESSRRTWHELE